MGATIEIMRYMLNIILYFNRGLIYWIMHKQQIA